MLALLFWIRSEAHWHEGTAAINREEVSRDLWHCIQWMVADINFSHLITVFLHVLQSIFISINEHKLVSVKLDSAPNVQILYLIINGGVRL